jgi:hypothetical protein
LERFGASLTEAVAYFIQSREGSTITVQELCARYVTSREQLELSDGYVKIEPVLAAWLRRNCLAEIGKPDLIQAENFRRRFDIARRTAGFRIRGPQETREDGEPFSDEEIGTLEKTRIPCLMTRCATVTRAITSLSFKTPPF